MVNLDVVRIELSIFDAGCLPGILADQVKKAEQLLALPAALSAEQTTSVQTYLAQVRACAAAVKLGREAAVVLPLDAGELKWEEERAG